VNAPAVINVDLAPGGAWEVLVPVRGERVLCSTLDDAVRMGYRYASDGEGCELVVRDAYHRVLRHELVSASGARN
jgi:hypothetical protein